MLERSDLIDSFNENRFYDSPKSSDHSVMLPKRKHTHSQLSLANEIQKTRTGEISRDIECFMMAASYEVLAQ